jgi:hypothetical protein
MKWNSPLHLRLFPYVLRYVLLTFEFYSYKLGCLTVFCMKPNIQFRKNFEGLVFAFNCIIQKIYEVLYRILWLGVRSSQRLKTAGFSGRNKINNPLLFCKIFRYL